MSKRWTKKTSDSQHAALLIVANALRDFVQSGDWGKYPLNPYTGNHIYITLEDVQEHIIEECE